MGQTSPVRRPWHSTFRAAALGGASVLVIAALAGDKALGADTFDGTAIQLAQRPTGGGTPPKDLTDPSQPWNSQDIANAEKLSGQLRDASTQFEALGEHFVKIGQPGMVQWVKAMLDYFDGLLKALSGNAMSAMAGGGLTPDQGTQARQTLQRGGDAQKAKEKLEAFEQSSRTATGGQTGPTPQTPQTPNTGQSGQAPTRTPTGQAAQGSTRTPTGQQVAQGPGPNATLIPNNPASLPSIVQGGTVTGSPQDQLVLNTACYGDLHASLGAISDRFGGIRGSNGTVTFDLARLSSAPLFFPAPSGPATGAPPVKVGIAFNVAALQESGKSIGDLPLLPRSFLDAYGADPIAPTGFREIVPGPDGVYQPVQNEPNDFADFRAESTIVFTARGVADNGLEYSAKVELDSTPPRSDASDSFNPRGGVADNGLEYGAKVGLGSNPPPSDASSFFNTGNLSHELKFGAGYRNTPVESRSFWDAGGYQMYSGPSQTGPIEDTHIFSSNFYLTGLYSKPAPARWGDYSDQTTYICPKFTGLQLPQTYEPAQGMTIQMPRPNDPLSFSRGTWRQSYDDQWWLKAINWLKADGTTVLPERAKPVTVAVIDTGLDIGHPELFGAVWVNPDEPRAAPPGMLRNPRKMRLFGWNFVSDSIDLRDFNGHGTVVAGIIAANVNNGQGIAGVNPWARIMPLKVADHRGHTDTIKVAKAIVFAANNGARVINVSLGAQISSEVVRRAIDYAAAKNVLVVVSAGNAGVDVKGFTPSAFANTIAVAAVDTASNRAGFSNFGDNITISAPGVDILSLRAGGTDLMRFVKADYQPGSAVVNERYYRVDGTSFAAPMVAGVASLILSMRPELSAADVKRMVLQSARDIGDPGRDRNLGYGMLDADAALKADPAFFVDGTITNLAVVQSGGRQAVRVTGVASADRMKSAWVEVGSGESPTEWKKVTDAVTRPVDNGVIGDFATSNLAGSKVWTVRVVVEHQNGRKREGRYVLRLG